MRNSAASLIVVITLLTAGALVAPAPCCAPKISAAVAVRAVDCCDSMVDCPRTPEAGLPAVAPVENSAAAAPALSVDVPGSSDLDRVSTEPASVAALTDKPPLYRLHAQLLI